MEELKPNSSFLLMTIVYCPGFSANSSNSSLIYSSHIQKHESGLNPSESIRRAIIYFQLSLAVFNVILNFLSLVIFKKWQRSPMITILIFLSFCEVLWNFAIFPHTFILTFFQNDNQTIITSINRWIALFVISLFLPLVKIVARGFLITRNWAVALIAFARCEAVAYPMKPEKICEGKSLWYIQMMLVTIGLLFGNIRLFEDHYIVCSQNYKIFKTQDSTIGSHYYYKHVFLNFGFLFLQGFGPTLSVLGTSVTLVYYLRSAPTAAQRKGSPRSIRKERTVNRVVMLLCLIFFILETPQGFLYLLITNNDFKLESSTISLLVACGNTIKVVDSTCNFIIYISMNRKFRNSLLSLITSYSLSIFRQIENFSKRIRIIPPH